MRGTPGECNGLSIYWPESEFEFNPFRDGGVRGTPVDCDNVSFFVCADVNLLFLSESDSKLLACYACLYVRTYVCLLVCVCLCVFPSSDV